MIVVEDVRLCRFQTVCLTMPQRDSISSTLGTCRAESSTNGGVPGMTIPVDVPPGVSDITASIDYKPEN